MQQQPRAGGPVPAKVVPPEASGLERRAGLRRRCTAGSERAVVWVEGPPGAGKTTLAARALDEFPGHRVWLRIDAGDADPADFFHFLGRAAMRAGLDGERLPRFTPEYAPDPATFARVFLHACSEQGHWCLVLDNLDHVAPGTPPFDVIAAARAARTPASLLIATSRAAVPAELARLRVEGALELVDGDMLRLTRREATAIARATAPPGTTDAAVEHAWERSGGWPAGFRLLLGTQGDDAERAGDRTPRVLLEYLEREFLDRLPPATRRLLLQLAPLDTVPLAVVESLAGADGVARLEALARDHAFLARDAGGGAPCYRIHPLLGECLEARAAHDVAAATRAQWRAATGDALERAGETEAAVDEWLAAGSWESAAKALRALAPQQLEAGRHHAVAERLERLPAAAREADPWLALWFATARIPAAPPEARAGLHAAYGAFRDTGEREGAALAWAGMAESMWIEWGDHDALAWLLDELDWLAGGDDAMSTAVRARLAAQAVLLLGILRPEARATLAHWSAIAENAAADARVAPAQQLTILHVLLAFDAWLHGAPEHGENLLARGRRLEATRTLPPLTRLMWYGAAAGHRFWFARDARTAIPEAERGLALAEASGVHHWDFQLSALAACGALGAADLDAAAPWLDALDRTGRPEQALDASFHAWITGWAAMCRGDIAVARARARDCREQIAGGGPWNARALARFAIAQAERHAGAPAAALEHVLALRSASTRTRAGMHRWIAAILRALCLLDAGQDGAARRLLAGALAYGRRAGYVRLPWCTAGDVGAVCTAALHAGVPGAYVQRLAAANGRGDWQPPAAAGDWPWAVSVHALGGLAVAVDATPLRIRGKGAALLRMLATGTASSLPQEHVIDALWPDVEGDRGRRSLDTTLHRLRHRLGHPEAIRMVAGRIELDPACCWTDVRALDELLAAALEGDEAAWRDALQLLEGVGAPAAEWPGAAGELLRRRLAQAAEARFGAALAGGDPGRVLADAEAVLDVDDVAEGVAQRALEAAALNGEPGRAETVYARCRAALRARLGVGPSERTASLYRAATSATG